MSITRSGEHMITRAITIRVSAPFSLPERQLLQPLAGTLLPAAHYMVHTAQQILPEEGSTASPWPGPCSRLLHATFTVLSRILLPLESPQ